MAHYLATEIFEVEVNLNKLFPLNLDFKIIDPKINFEGPGIYFMYFKKELIYIGSFHSSNLKNDVREQRWIKELATISMRGSKLTFNEVSVEEYQNSTNLRNLIESFPPKGDFLTSKNRVKFANNNWEDFRENYFLRHFEFCWLPIKYEISKEHLERTTKELRLIYKPICNN